MKDLAQLAPEISLRVQAGGSNLAPAALADGTAAIAAMSRAMNSLEISAFEARRGFRPTPVRVALDAVTVLVNAVNPTPGLTLTQLDEIFSADRQCGMGQNISVWGQVTPIWRSRPLQLVGAGWLSGTRDYFRARALCGGGFKRELLEKADPTAVAGAVRDSANAIAYIAMAFRGKGTKALPVAGGNSARFVDPTPANVLSGAYPLTRYLYLYLAKPPDRPLPPRVQRFMAYVLSAQGQKRVGEVNYVPLPASVSLQEMAKLR